MLIISKRRIFMVMVMAGILLATSAAAEELSKVQSETLMRTSESWDGQSYKAYPKGPPELTVLKISIPAKTELAWHTHPMPNAAYVLSGEITVQKKETGETRLLKAGQVLPEMVDELHRGYTGDIPVVLIVFYAGTKGMPLSQPQRE